MNKKQTLIIGLGTGRCGTKSLASLLGKCKGISSSHEFRGRNSAPHRLSWYFSKKEIKERLNYIDKYEHPFVADVSSYYLNYIEYLVKNVKKLKIIYLHRPIREVTNSFMSKTHFETEKDTNHWFSYSHKDMKNGIYRKVSWDRCFPKYKRVKNKRRAILRYCRHYEKKMDKYFKKYPDKILPIELRFFNCKETQRAMYRFIGISPRNRVYENVIENKRKDDK